MRTYLDANILSGRFVLARESADTDKPFHKVRFLVQGNRYREKHMLLRN